MWQSGQALTRTNFNNKPPLLLQGIRSFAPGKQSDKKTEGVQYLLL